MPKYIDLFHIYAVWQCPFPFWGKSELSISALFYLKTLKSYELRINIKISEVFWDQMACFTSMIFVYSENGIGFLTINNQKFEAT